MTRIHPEIFDFESSDRPVTATNFLRQEPQDEEEEDEDQPDNDEDDDAGDEGYSE